MKYTLSWHNQGDKANQGHNRRDEKSISKSSNIDVSKIDNNIVIVDQDVRDAYKELFQSAVDEFNARQKNQDRIINDYYSKINKDPKKHTAYECIVQIGGKAEGWPAEDAVNALIDYTYSFEDRNPNLHIIGAYIHQDEEGAPHLHLDYIPFAECSRGMGIQTTLTGALKAQGFITKNRHDTAQIQWEQSERDAMREICSNLNIDLQEQGVGRKRHFTVPEYKALQDQMNTINRHIDTLEHKRQLTQDGLARDREEWANFHHSTFSELEYLQAFHTAVEQYEPEYSQAVNEFLEYWGQDQNDWPDTMITDEPQADPDPDWADELDL